LIFTGDPNRIGEVIMNGGDELILKREIKDLQVWRSTFLGMWAWLLQRISAILIIVFLTLHFLLPYRRPIQFLLLLLLVVHASLGIRVMLIDLGANVKTQKFLFIVLLLLGLFFLVWIWNRLPLGG